jgi:hypothetical protein
VNDYVVRAATLDDIDILVHHRVAMFTDIGTPFDASMVERTFREWVLGKLASGEYLAWVCETSAAAHLYKSLGYSDAPHPMMWAGMALVVGGASLVLYFRPH